MLNLGTISEVIEYSFMLYKSKKGPDSISNTGVYSLSRNQIVWYIYFDLKAWT
jgi:hypothetical protein